MPELDGILAEHARTLQVALDSIARSGDLDTAHAAWTVAQLERGLAAARSLRAHLRSLPGLPGAT